ncbi:MAG: hypothetical protein BWY64_01991 [bacterium ADurb.Bin363]|nr:MAG: hypothetical protein BWY64_01991 [bacterium ADurb.Bin363]
MARRASLRAPSTASAPLLQRKEKVRSPGVISASNLDKSARGLEKKSFDERGILSSCFFTASTISGCLCPNENTPYPPAQSIYSLPSISLI